MADYLKIKGLGSIVLVGDAPEQGKDYLISIRAGLSAITENVEDPDEPRQTYILKYINTEQVMEVGASKKLKVQNGKTPSQILRYLILEYLGSVGKEQSEENYKAEMDKIIAHYRSKLDN
jgi:hypothetical protein